jgi:hypothetical protein
MEIPFKSKDLEIPDYWRAIILFGRNVASYKFALAKTLLELKPESGQLLKLSDIAPSFSRNITDHLKIADKQGTSRTSSFLDSCRKYNNGELNDNDLMEATERYGFLNVIDAFHVVAQKEVPVRFYIDERKNHNGIRITDEFSKLLSSSHSAALPHEAESRWRLVETAWELGVSRSLVSIQHDSEHDQLIAQMTNNRRKSVTGSKEALNGYQKGKCFYCGARIAAGHEGIQDVEVDHFFPHALKQFGFSSIIDGIWNLVLACPECNRGPQGKFARVPSLQLLSKLHIRNEHLINSHHPLRETLMMQTGPVEKARIRFLLVSKLFWSEFLQLFSVEFPQTILELIFAWCFGVATDGRSISNKPCGSTGNPGHPRGARVSNPFCTDAVVTPQDAA